MKRNEFALIENGSICHAELAELIQELLGCGEDWEKGDDLLDQLGKSRLRHLVISDLTDAQKKVEQDPDGTAVYWTMRGMLRCLKAGGPPAKIRLMWRFFKSHYDQILAIGGDRSYKLRDEFESLVFQNSPAAEAVAAEIWEHAKDYGRSYSVEDTTWAIQDPIARSILCLKSTGVLLLERMVKEDRCSKAFAIALLQMPRYIGAHLREEDYPVVARIFLRLGLAQEALSGKEYALKAAEVFNCNWGMESLIECMQGDSEDPSVLECLQIAALIPAGKECAEKQFSSCLRSLSRSSCAAIAGLAQFAWSYRKAAKRYGARFRSTPSRVPLPAPR